MTTTRVRFAPSPTGKLHIGGARTAIINWAFARATGGSFILRIEDTDPKRSTRENIDLILRAIDWLGLDIDEGPLPDGTSKGDSGPYFQTQRTASYDAALDRLRESDSAYPCFCTSEELAERREAVSKGAAPAPDPCRSLSDDEARSRIDSGEPHVWRLRVPEDRGVITVDDAVHGPTDFDSALTDDMIVCRSDGTVTYNFAVVCDDLGMGITHVIRGDDHLSNTPRQVLVYEALGEETPVFCHLPMICGPDGKKLSKRHGAASVEEYRDMGFLPDALFNYLALLGWAPDGETTMFSRAEMASLFSLDHVSKNPSSMDPAKLEWMNGQYVQKLGADGFAREMVPWLEEAGYGSGEEVLDVCRSAYPLVSERVKRMSEAVPMIRYLLDDEITLDERSVSKVLAKEGARADEALDGAARVLGGIGEGEWECERIEGALRGLADELEMKAKLVFQPVRVAVTGNMVSPPLFESIELLGRARTLERIEKAAPLTV